MKNSRNRNTDIIEETKVNFFDPNKYEDDDYEKDEDE